MRKKQHDARLVTRLGWQLARSLHETHGGLSVTCTAFMRSLRHACYAT